jgi:hypothetical protein
MFFLKNDDYFKFRKNIVKYEKEFNKIDSQEIFNKLNNAFIDYLSYMNYLLFENKCFNKKNIYKKLNDMIRYLHQLKYTQVQYIPKSFMKNQLYILHVELLKC